MLSNTQHIERQLASRTESIAPLTDKCSLRAIIWYIYTGEIDFSSDFPVVPGVSAKSVYRFADEVCIYSI